MYLKVLLKQIFKEGMKMASFLYVTSCTSCRKVSILVGSRCLHFWDSSTL